MKKIVPGILWLLSTINPAIAGDWVGDFVTGAMSGASTTSSGPINLRSAERGYSSYGSFSARFPVTNEYPITVSPPRLKMGCGGIDVWAGGLSYIDDPAYYVSKLQGSLRSAAFIAFDMALKNMCQACSDAMATAENLAAKINSLNLNECAIGKGIVTTVKSNLDPDVQATRAAEIAQERAMNATTGAAKNPSDAKSLIRTNNGAADANAKMGEALDACPKEFTDIYKNGSLIGNIAEKIGLGLHKEILRGYIGDVKITFDATTNNFSFATLEPCPRDLSLDLDALIWGEAQKRQISDDTCVVDSANTLVAQTKTHLSNLANTYKNNTAVQNTAAESFIALVPLNVSQNLKSAVIYGSEINAIDLMAEPVATLYAGRALQDLLDRGDAIIKYGVEAADNPGVKPGGSVDNCRRELVGPAVEYLKALRPRMWEMRKVARMQMTQKLQEIAVSLSVAKAEEERYAKAQNVVLKGVSEK